MPEDLLGYSTVKKCFKHIRAPNIMAHRARFCLK